MKTKHTPGSWIIETNVNHYPFITDEKENRLIAKLIESDGGLFYGRELSETNANAKLIAAAPDLLEACRWAVEQFKILADKGLYPEHLMADNGGEGMMPLVNAIKKATE